MKKNVLKRVLSLLLCMVLVASYLPVSILTAVAEPTTMTGTDRVTDPSTLNQWKQYFGTQTNHPQGVQLSTEFAGGVWTDKSVFTPGNVPTELTRAKYQNKTFGLTDKGDNFLVALSALASNKQIKGYSTIPTDTVLILDLSSSMRSTGEGGSSAVDELVEATNKAITELQALNENNRVAVVVYAGTDNASWSARNGKTRVILPLDSYTTTHAGVYLEAYDRDQALRVSSSVRNSAGQSANANSDFATSTGTFAQDGLYMAMQELLKADPVVENGFQAGVNRIPIMVLMSDGEPTLGSNSYYGTYTTSGGKKTFTDLGSSVMYSYSGNTTAANGVPSITHRNTIAFMTSLTAAFAKKQITAHYGEGGLLYTLAYGNTVTTRSEAMSLLNPKNSSSTQNDMWSRFLNGETVRVYSTSRTSHLTTQNASDPNLRLTAADRYYVDEFFAAANDEAMRSAFDAIVDEIELQSRYYPTYVKNDHNHDGYLTFVDKIGAHMEVSDIKGIVIGNRLFSGAAMASQMTTNSMGSATLPSGLGEKFVQSVQTRLNIDNLATAQALITNAYRHGQLAYNAQTGEFSAYIGWFSDSSGNFLDFWHKDLAKDNYPANAAYIMRSYGFLGDTSVIPGVPNTDMMFMTVRVATEIRSGDSTITWKIPASLVPTVTYEVEVNLDSTGKLTGLQSLSLADNSATDPIRLLYEVELAQDITEWNLAEKTGGITTFYTNDYDAADPSATTRNTYSQFEPSLANERYYYTSDHLIYSNTNGTVYQGSKPVSGTYYHQFPVYEKTASGLRIHYHYEPVTAASLALAESAGNNQWVVPKGTVLRYQDDVTTLKTENPTGTMAYSDHPQIVAEGTRYYTYSTQGNNGRLTVSPATGIKLTKTLAEAVAGASDRFTFTVSGDTAGAVVIRLDESGMEKSREALANGQVTLTAGESVFLIGLTPGNYTVTENTHEAYTVTAVTVEGQLQSGSAANVALRGQQIADVQFTNGPKGYGNLLITKEVRHANAGHMVPESMLEQTFPVTVHVGTALAGQTFRTLQDTTEGSVTIGADGSFTATIQHGRSFEILGLPDGTAVTVTEETAGMPSYYRYDSILTRDHTQAQQDSDNVVTIATDANATAVIRNVYTPAPTTAALDVSLSKNFILESPLDVDADFLFRFEKWNGTGWELVNEGSIAYAAGESGVKQISLQNALRNLTYSEAGDYAYRIIEVIPADADKIPGVSYDRSEYNFTVRVTDNGGQLVATVIDDNQPVTGTYTVTFTNTYHTAPASLEIQKYLNITSGNAEVPKSGFLFEAYVASVDDAGNWTLNDEIPDLTVRSDAAGHARFAAIYDQVGTHHYVVREKNEGRPGWTYDATEYHVTVEVTDDGTGNLTAAVTTMAAGAAQPVSGPLSFTNSYDPTDAVVDLNTAVTKVLTGKTMQAGEFTFALFASGAYSHNTTAGALLTGTNAADGSVALGSLTFDRIGIYEYDIVEIRGSNAGITYDSRVYDLVVEVTDDHQGQLTANWYFEDAPDQAVTFRNTYDAADAAHIISGTKTMQGRPLLLGGFTFRLTEVADENGTALANAQTWTAENGSADLGNTASFRFPAITYQETGTHYYTVTEENTGAIGVTYDTNRYVIRVDVTDNGQGQLITAERILSGGTAIAFHNTYKPQPITTNLRSVKTLNGMVLTAGQFSFTIQQTGSDFATPVSGGLKATVTNDATGLIQFPDITFYGNDTRYYVVREENGGKEIDGISYDDAVYRVTITATDNLLGDLVLVTDIKVEKDGEIAHADTLAFTNEYAVKGDASLILSGEKTLTGAALTNGQFTFQLLDESGAVVASGSNTGAAYAVRMDYTAEKDLGKTYRYTLTEQYAGQTIHGTTYDSKTYAITVEVLDDNHGGIRLLVTTDGQQTTDGKLTTVTGLDFVNTYHAQPTAVTVTGTKTLEGLRALKANDFTFLLYKTDARFGIDAGVAPVATAKNGADGKFTFAAQTLTTAGAHYFVVKESSDSPLKGVTYDTASYLVTVTVTDDGKGQLAVSSITYQKVSPTGTEAASAIRFTNVYTPADAIVTLQGSKTLSGKTLTEKAFTFLLQQTDSSFTAPIGTAAEVTNSADGSFRFDPLRFSRPGTYCYTVTEKAGAVNTGITYDETVYRITVVVADDENGKLIPSVTVNNSLAKVTASGNEAAVTGITFQNRYDAAGTTPITLKGTKTVSGLWELKANDFTFRMFRADEQFVIQGAAIQTVQNGADGRIAFGDLSFSTAGKHYFVIKESSENPIPGMTYDETVYHLTVTVTDNGLGQLELAGTKLEAVTAAGKTEVTEIAFRNSYDAQNTTLLLTGKKVLEGKALTDGEFTFLLQQTDSSFTAQDSTAPKQAVNGADGSFAFDAITYDAPGTYYYTVSEENTGNARVTFDETVYHVTVTVTDENGVLKASAAYATDAGKADEMVFTNVYTPKPLDLPIAIAVQKTVKNLGAQKIGPEGFTFVLEGSPEAKLEAVSDANGVAVFNLTVTEDHIGSTYRYKLYEVDGGKAHVTYSTAVYEVAVTVSLSADNQLVAHITYNGEAAESAAFENVYDYTPPATPQTGDSMNLPLFFTMAVLSLLGMACCIVARKKLSV